MPITRAVELWQERVWNLINYGSLFPKLIPTIEFCDKFGIIHKADKKWELFHMANFYI